MAYAKPIRIGIMFLVLAVFWILLSGLFKPLLLILGLVSCALVVWLMSRTSLFDATGVVGWIHWWNWLKYHPWLALQVIKSNIDVIKQILNPRLSISPTIKEVPAELSDLGQVIYANSITLTPGTISMKVNEDTILVHSLTEAGIEDLESGEMYERVRRLDVGAPSTNSDSR